MDTSNSSRDNQKRHTAQRTIHRRLTPEDKSRLIREQFQQPTIEYHTDPITGAKVAKRVPLSRVINHIEQSLNEADQRLNMLKVYVEIAMMGSEASKVQQMIQRGEAFVRALDAESGSFGDKGKR